MEFLADYRFQRFYIIHCQSQARNNRGFFKRKPRYVLVTSDAATSSDANVFSQCKSELSEIFTIQRYQRGIKSLG